MSLAGHLIISDSLRKQRYLSKINFYDKLQQPEIIRFVCHAFRNYIPMCFNFILFYLCF